MELTKEMQGENSQESGDRVDCRGRSGGHGASQSREAEMYSL